jgi:hypothetical protein
MPTTMGCWATQEGTRPSERYYNALIGQARNDGSNNM